MPYEQLVSPAGPSRDVAVYREDYDPIPPPKSVYSFAKCHAILAAPGMGRFPSLMDPTTGGPQLTTKGILPITGDQRTTPFNLEDS